LLWNCCTIQTQFFWRLEHCLTCDRERYFFVLFDWPNNTMCIVWVMFITSGHSLNGGRSRPVLVSQASGLFAWRRHPKMTPWGCSEIPSPGHDILASTFLLRQTRHESEAVPDLQDPGHSIILICHFHPLSQNTNCFASIRSRHIPKFVSLNCRFD